ESRERYMKMLPRLCKKVEHLSAAITTQYAELSAASSRSVAVRLRAFQRSVAALQRLYPRFYFKQKVTEEFVHLADQHFATISALKSDPHHRPYGRGRSAPIKKEEVDCAAWLS